MLATAAAMKSAPRPWLRRSAATRIRSSSNRPFERLEHFHHAFQALQHVRPTVRPDRLHHHRPLERLRRARLNVLRHVSPRGAKGAHLVNRELSVRHELAGHQLDPAPMEPDVAQGRGFDQREQRADPWAARWTVPEGARQLFRFKPIAPAAVALGR